VHTLAPALDLILEEEHHEAPIDRRATQTPGQWPPETGVPTTRSDASSGPALDARSGVTTDTPASGETILAAASAYDRVWWKDVVNLKVTETRSNITWGYNGSCTTSVSGSGYWWWRSGTGWLSSSYGKNQSRTCSVAKAWSDATYKNGAFCWPGTVRNYYDSVEVRGWYNSGCVGAPHRQAPGEASRPGPAHARDARRSRASRSARAATSLVNTRPGAAR
jgi:hypothetical protein